MKVDIGERIRQAHARMLSGELVFKPLPDYGEGRVTRLRDLPWPDEPEKVKHKRIPRKPPQVTAEFWENVTKTDYCWTWTGDFVGEYGSWLGHGAHRCVHYWLNGSFPLRRHVHHTCENKQCVNPAHLKDIEPIDHMRLHHPNMVR